MVRTLIIKVKKAFIALYDRLTLKKFRKTIVNVLIFVALFLAVSIIIGIANLIEYGRLRKEYMSLVDNQETLNSKMDMIVKRLDKWDKIIEETVSRA
jgi:cell division protein FtsL